MYRNSEICLSEFKLTIKTEENVLNCYATPMLQHSNCWTISLKKRLDRNSVTRQVAVITMDDSFKYNNK